jgi:predicted RNA binding protein YcfA (HicA-like mRNA interferase family)
VKLPRDVSGLALIKALRKLGYASPRQKGSHIRITTQENGEHHEVIPNHNPIKVGTLHGIRRSIAAHHQLTMDELLERLDL